jgi:arylsulfatase A-like enzyme
LILFAAATSLCQPARPPNIIVICSDDHAAHAVSAYGSKIIQTPNIDRIAAEGARFQNAFVTNSLCGPSRATLLTGKYAHKHNFADNQAGRTFDGAQMTFPKLLQQAGYETAVYGKWHLRSDPTGFDKWLVVDGYALYNSPNFKDAVKGVQKIEGYTTDTIFNNAIDFVKNRSQSRPFFMLVTPNAPHRKWDPDEKHKLMFADKKIPPPATFEDDYATRTRAARECTMSIENDLRKADLKQDPPQGLSGPALKLWKYQRWIQDYLACAASVDTGVGRLLDQLDRSGLSQNTLVIYTSDNGFFLGDHGWFDKRFMYEESLRVPFVARLPGVIQPGAVIEQMNLNIDSAPTLLDFAGAKIPTDVQGKSWRALVDRSAKPAKPWRSSMYYHFYEREPEHNAAPHFGVRTATHKLIHFYTNDEWELYDLTVDRQELKNVYNNPAYAVKRNELKAELERLRREFADEQK